jgi:hypothetical protein
VLTAAFVAGCSRGQPPPAAPRRPVAATVLSWGTSAARVRCQPAEFAGVVAIADQFAHQRLGLLNPALYQLARNHAPGIEDITAGNNTVSFTQEGQTFTVAGFPALPSYDLASGLGTVDACPAVLCLCTFDTWR